MVFSLLLAAGPIARHASGWAACFPGRWLPFRFRRLVRMWMAGSAIQDVTPTAAIGGEIAKVLFQAMATGLMNKASIPLAKMGYIALG
jgi:hypothetical protein